MTVPFTLQSLVFVVAFVYYGGRVICSRWWLFVDCYIVLFKARAGINDYMVVRGLTGLVGSQSVLTTSWLGSFEV